MSKEPVGLPATQRRIGIHLKYKLLKLTPILILLTIATILVIPSLALAADSEELAALNSINSYRVKNGLCKLQLSSTLSKAALGHSADMANKNYFEHDSLNGASFVDRIAAAGYKTNTSLGENIAAGMQTGVDVFNGWRNSPKHNEIMLGKDFRAIGIARAYNAKSTYKWYWTADFGGRAEQESQTVSQSSSSKAGNSTSASQNVWGTEHLVWLAKNKGLTGYPGGNLCPGNNVTRAELAVMIAKTLNIKPGGRTVFKDSKNHWARYYVAALADKGILVGYVDGKFKPDKSVTRAEMTQVITKAAGLHFNTSKTPFADIEGHWAKTTIIIAASNNIVTGYANGKFRPDISCTRAEAAAILRRLVQ